MVDLHPRHGNVVLAAGFSGTGFKMGPVTGDILADLAEGRAKERIKYDLASMSVARFGGARL